MTFSSRLADIENEFIESLEAWRIAMSLEKLILLGKNCEIQNTLILLIYSIFFSGHGFGGYVAFLYTSRFPERVRHVVFVEPWGFDVDPKHYKRFRSFRPPTFPVTNTTKLAAFLITYLNHFSLLRFVGPGWGNEFPKVYLLKNVIVTGIVI